MNFKEWLDFYNINRFFNDIKSQVLSSMRELNGYISFSFPSNYEQYVNIPLLAAHYDPSLLESKDLPKGELGYKATKGKVNWEEDEVEIFKKIINQHLKDIAKFLGLIFELEVYDFLTNSKSLISNNYNPANPIMIHKPGRGNYGVSTKAAKVRYINKIIFIIDYKGNLDVGKIITSWIYAHASEVGESMYRRAKTLLGCVDQISFSGGEPSSYYTDFRKDPADIKLGCSENKKEFGASLKFTSEPKSHIAHLSILQTYVLLGGKKLKSFHNEYNGKNKDEKVELALDTFYELMDSKIVGKPDKFVDILNQVLTAKTKGTQPVVRLWTRGRGDAFWSKAIRKDFNFKGSVLRTKDNAEVSADKTRTYVRINYKVPGGNEYGTSIWFRVKSNSVVVSVNNLASN